MFLLVIGLDIAELALEYMSRGSINNNNHRSTLLRPHVYYPISLTSTHKKIGDFTKEQLTIVHYCMYIKAQLHKDAFFFDRADQGNHDCPFGIVFEIFVVG